MKNKDLELTPQDKEIFEQYRENNPHLFPDAIRDYSSEVSRMKQTNPSDLDLLSSNAGLMPYANKTIAPKTQDQRDREIAYWSEVTNPEQSNKESLTYDGVKRTVAHFIQNYCENKGMQFKYTDMNICAIQNLIAYFLHDVNGKYSSRKGLWIYGNLGAGKTFMADLFAKVTRHFNLPKKYLVISAEEVADRVRSEKKLDSISTYLGKTNYCFDDAGRERPVKIYGEEEDVMLKIIKKAYRADKKLIITSNLAPAQAADALRGIGMYSIEDRYTDEITLSRIYEMFNFVPVIGSNKRKMDCCQGCGAHNKGIKRDPVTKKNYPVELVMDKDMEIPLCQLCVSKKGKL